MLQQIILKYSKIGGSQRKVVAFLLIDYYPSDILQKMLFSEKYLKITRHFYGRYIHVRAFKVQVNLDMTDSMGPGKLVCHMQHLSYSCTYDEYLICIGLGPSILSVVQWSVISKFTCIRREYIFQVDSCIVSGLN